MAGEAIAVAEPGLSRDGDGSPRAGSLVYTRAGLASLFLWLLGGDFAFSFFEQIFGKFIPLFAKEQHASDTLIGVMNGSIAGLVNLFSCRASARAATATANRAAGAFPF